MAKSRPITTSYDNEHVAHSTTKMRAVQAAARRVLAGDYWHAIVEEDGKEVARIASHKSQVFISLSKRYWK